MVWLVSIDEVKAMQKLDGDDIDAALMLLIPAASGSVVNYLKAGADAFIGEDGEVTSPEAVPSEVKAATVILVGHMMRNPDNDTEGAFEPGYLPRPVTALLYHLRDPAVA